MIYFYGFFLVVLRSRLLQRPGDAPHPDLVVRVPGEECGSVRGPGQGGAVWGLGLLADGWELWPELVHGSLGLQVPNLDGVLGGGAQPVPVRGEAQVVDDVTGVEGVEPLSVGEVPQDGDSVLSSGGAQGSVWGDGDGVAVPSVPGEVGPQLAVGEVPHLDHLVPAAGHDEGDLGGRGEPDTGDPLAVAVLVLDSVLALSEGVPQLDGPVPGSAHDLPVVRGEGHGQDVLGVPEEAPGGGSGVQVPEPQGVVPGAGEGELSVAGDDDVLDVVRVSPKTPEWVSERLLRGEKNDSID